MQNALRIGTIRRKPVQIRVSESNAKAEQAWKYPNCEIARAPSTRLGNRTYTDPKSNGQARRQQESNFFITINTNKHFDDESIERASQCMGEMLNALASDRVFPQYLKFGPRDAVFATDSARDVISRVDWNASVEVGGHLGRLHAHIYLSILHYSQLQINAKKMSVLARQAFNACARKVLSDEHLVSNMYVHVDLQAQKDHDQILTRYLSKCR